MLLHANAANTMLTGTYLDPVPDSQTLLWVAVDHRGHRDRGAAAPALGVDPDHACWSASSYVVFAFTRFNNGHVMNFVYPSMAVLFAFIGGLGLRYFGETRQRRRVTALFSQYVPEAVAQRLVDEDRAGSAVEGERLDMTVLFCDLRGFTAMSENLEPAIVRMMLNHYYDRVTDIVLAMDGTLMKYVGDEVFAVWGAPLPSTDHPQRALECAIAIQALTPDLNRELVEQGAPGGVVRDRPQHRRRRRRALRRWSSTPVRRGRRHGERRGSSLLGRGTRRHHPVRSGVDPRPVAPAGRTGRSDRIEGCEP